MVDVNFNFRHFVSVHINRFSEVLKFETFGVNDLSQIIGQLSEVTFTPDAIEYIHAKFNRFRQIVQLINQMENFAKENNLTEITYEMIVDFMQKMKERYRPKTASNAVTLLGSILKSAFQEGYIKINPYYGKKSFFQKKI